MFNSRQEETINKLREFIDQRILKVFYLFGYAGTGKTFIVSKITKDFLVENKVDNIYYCAPTHKALNVLESYIKSNINGPESVELFNRVNFMTIHKLLEFKPVIQTETGSKIFKSTKESKFLKKISNILIVIDECSMISLEMMVELEKYISLYPIKIIFMGDPMQLPPVGEPESTIFSTVPNNYKFHIVLDEIMRTKSTDIKAVCTAIRNWDLKTNIGQIFCDIHNKSKDKKFRLYHIKPDYKSASWFKQYVKEIQNNETPIIITWRNSVSDTYNNLVRKFIHKSENLDNYIIGDYIMFNNYYVAGTESFYTSDTAKIIDVKTNTKFLYDWNQLHIEKPMSQLEHGYNDTVKKLIKMNNQYNINVLDIKRIQTSIDDLHDDGIYTIQVINFTHLDKYKSDLKEIKKIIEMFFRKYRSERLTSEIWDTYHKKLIEPYAEINFGYSISSHKSQGSTYEKVNVDVNDICSNPNKLEMIKSLYTSAGRASKVLRFMIE